MSIFSSDKTVVGLFNNDEDVETVVNELTRQGFGQEEDEFRVIDGDYLRGNTTTDIPVAVAATPGGAGSEGAVAIPVDVTRNTGDESTVVQHEVNDILTQAGMDDDEAIFYADQVKRGAKLIVIETDKDRASLALEILKQNDSQASMS